MRFVKTRDLGKAIGAVVQQMEARRLLSFTTFEEGSFIVHGTTQADTITVSRVGDVFKAKMNGVTESHSIDDVLDVEVFADAGKDVITITADIGTFIVGGDDADLIKGGPNQDTVLAGDGNDTVYGNGGNDTINDNDGADVIDGGSGDDTILAGATADGRHDGADTYTGGPGVDTVDYNYRENEAVTASLDGKKNDGSTGENDWIKGDVENLTGGSLNDMLTGNDGPNVIYGGGFFAFGTQDDTIFGLGGDDDLNGYKIDPGLGNDAVFGIVIDYSKRTAPLTFSLSGVNDNGNPTFVGGQAGETDTLSTSLFTATPIVYLGSGNDKFTDADQIELHGGPGKDTLSTQDDEPFYTTVLGEGGDDTITAGMATLVSGGPGKDTISGNPDGRNILNYADATVPVAISYDNNPNNDGPVGEGDKVTVEGFSQVLTGSGNDTLIGNADDQTFFAGAGNDLLVGGEGFNSLYGEDGNDTLKGGHDADSFYGGQSDGEPDAFIDTVDYSSRTDDLTLAVNGFENGNAANSEQDYIDNNIDVVLGGSGNDLITGTDKAETLVGNKGNDTIAGGDGNDSIQGNDGDDDLSGDAGRDTVRGGIGRDLVDGGVGKDTLFGDAGNDVLSAIDGTVDVLDGGLGTDYALADKGTIKDQLFAVEKSL